MRGKRHRQSKSSNHLVKPNSSFCNLSHPSHPFTSDFLNLSESFRIFLRSLNSLSICRLWYMLTYIICITHILYSLSIWFPGFRSRLKFWKTSCRRWTPCRILNLSLSMCVQFGPDPMELENWVWDTWDLRFEIRLLEGLCEHALYVPSKQLCSRAHEAPTGPLCSDAPPDGMTVQPSQSAQEPLEPLIESSRGPTYNGGGCPCSACSWLLKVYAILALLAILLAPIICLVAAFLPGGLGLGTLLAIAIGVPILCIVTLLWPVCLYDPDAYDNVGMTQFTLNGNTMTYENYYSKLVDFANAATTKTWRKDLGKWFEDFTTTDKMVGTWGCGTKMYYSFATCKEELQQMNSKISADTLKRESQLALGFFNNVSWREAGRFALGARKDDHAFCRPLLAEMFSAKSNPGWTPASLRSEFKSLFAHITTLDHNNRNGHRGANDPFFPSKTKSILTQWTLKVLHQVGLGMDLTDAEAEELSAMQTVGLLTAGATSTICSIYLFYAFFTKPTLLARAKYIEKQPGVIKFCCVCCFVFTLEIPGL